MYRYDFLLVALIHNEGLLEAVSSTVIAVCKLWHMSCVWDEV